VGIRSTAIGGGEGDGNSGAHAPESHIAIPAGIPYRIQMSDFIH
jgi:hypothetical protein